MKNKLMNGLSPSKIKSNTRQIKAKKVEASGIVWIAQNKQYLLISDEPYDTQPTLLIMNEQHQITGGLTFPDNIRIDDLESVSHYHGFLCLLSSLSHNNKGNLSKKRSKLVRFKYKNKCLRSYNSINVYKLIKQIQVQTQDLQLSRFLKKAIVQKSLDIEAHAIHQDNLLLGFKAPFLDSNKTVIMQIKAIDNIFSGNIASVQKVMTLSLLDPDSGAPMMLSDMLWIENDLYLLSVASVKKQKSILWRYQEQNSKLNCMHQFPGLKAEGICFRPDQCKLTIVFDRGAKKSSKYLSLLLPE